MLLAKQSEKGNTGDTDVAPKVKLDFEKGEATVGAETETEKEYEKKEEEN